MNEQKRASLLTVQDIRIGIAVALSLLLCQLTPIQALAACTSAIMCSQDGGNPSWKSLLTRLLGVVCGGVAGAAVSLLHGAVPNVFLFSLLSGLGILLTLILCRLAKLPYIAARVSAISFMLVSLMGGAVYALNRLVGTLCGGIIAVAVAFVWMYCAKKLPGSKTAGEVK